MTIHDDPAAALSWDGSDVPALLSVDPLGDDRFTGRHNQLNYYRSLFGGQVLGQSLAAACATVDGRPLHSMHGYFLRPGAGTRPIEYQVERTRDGRSFSTRRVTGSQGPETIFHMECSFHAAEPGWDHQIAMPDVPPPDALEDLRAHARTLGPELVERLGARLGDGMEVRPVRIAEVLEQQLHSRRLIWFRAPSAQGRDDPALHCAVLAWMSDFWISAAAAIRHATPLPDPKIQLASIDHAMWFHRPADSGDWLLFDSDSPSASGGTGLSRALIYDRAGRLVATAAQESLQRQLD